MTATTLDTVDRGLGPRSSAASPEKYGFIKHAGAYRDLVLWFSITLTPTKLER